MARPRCPFSGPDSPLGPQGGRNLAVSTAAAPIFWCASDGAPAAGLWGPAAATTRVRAVRWWRVTLSGWRRGCR
eukprot:1018661-Alexandrium_andersonii.AAC.1